jgi:hypothetical protein
MTTKEQPVSQAIQRTIEYIFYSEMEGRVDREDSWYSTYQLLHELQEKAADEENL